MRRYDGKTALIVVDMQNDFGHPDGSLYVRAGEETVPVVNPEVERARAEGAVVVYSQDWHPGSTPHFQKDGGIWPVHCVQGTWGAEFLEGLAVPEGSPVVRKGSGGEDGYSVFSVRDPLSGEVESTELERILRERGIERVVVAGIATDYCVKETVLDAVRRGFEPTVLRDGIRAVELQPGDGAHALDAMTEAGARVE